VLHSDLILDPDIRCRLPDLPNATVLSIESARLSWQMCARAAHAEMLRQGVRRNDLGVIRRANR